MLTIDELRKPQNKSGFRNVGFNQGAVVVPKPYQAFDGREGSETRKHIWKGHRRATAEEAAQDYCDYKNGVVRMLTIEDIRNPDRESEFNHVNSARGGGDKRGTIDTTERWRARAYAGSHVEGNLAGEAWSGPTRKTPEEAAQDYCDYINGQTGALNVTLKSHGHSRPERKRRNMSPKRAEANALLALARAEESKDTSGVVYLIGEKHDPLVCGSREIVKIGKASDDGLLRAIDMQTGNGRTLYVIAQIESDDIHTLERRLHAKFIHLNHCAEWFYRDNSILEEFGIETDGGDIIAPEGKLVAA